jgi:hypothetical protein
MTTLNEHIKSFISVWGEEYVDYLLASGYEPVLVTDGSSVKLSWRLTQGEFCATLTGGQVFTPV